MTTQPLPVRTRLFAMLLKADAEEQTDAAQLLALRRKRQRLLSTRLGRAIVGTDAPGVRVRELTIGGDSETRLRVHSPEFAGGSLPIVVNYHGGGWCIGSPEQSRWLASRVAGQVGAVVVSPTYRLGPEHPYPAATEDAWAALQWVHEHAADLGGDRGRIAVMGDSAGGNLAAVTALMARDTGTPDLSAQVLIYPVVEVHERWPSEDANALAPLLTSSLMRTFTRTYLADAADTQDWQASPIRATSHTGLPPTLILTAGHDPLRDHGTRYAETLRAAGVAAELCDFPDAIHGFTALPGAAPAAETALDEIVAFLRRSI